MSESDDPLDGVPFVAIGNDELGEPIGKTVACPHCGRRHKVEHSNPPMLSFVRCKENNNLYLVGVDWKRWER